jgi:hypothetical protein
MTLEEKRFAEAGPLLREAIAAFEKSAPDDWRKSHAQAMLAVVLFQTGARDEARPLLESGYQTLLQRQNVIPVFKRQVLEQVRDWNLQLR